jgi:hypothetical protein
MPARPGRLQLGGELVNGVAQAAGDPVAHVQAVVQMHLGVAVVGRGLAPFECELAKRVAGVGAQFFQPGRKVFAVPEVPGLAGHFLVAHDVQRLDEDHHPRGQRHAQQQQGHGAGDDVTLGP